MQRLWTLALLPRELKYILRKAFPALFPLPTTQKVVSNFSHPNLENETFPLDKFGCQLSCSKTVGCRPVINKHLVNRSHRGLKISRKAEISWTVEESKNQTFFGCFQPLWCTRTFMQKLFRRNFWFCLDGKGIVFNSRFNAFPSVFLCFWHRLFVPKV